jgi:hypothetical protein
MLVHPFTPQAAEKIDEFLQTAEKGVNAKEGRPPKWLS